MMKGKDSLKRNTYLHHYIGCECEYDWHGMEDDVPTGEKGRRTGTLDLLLANEADELNLKLILRPQSQIRKTEKKKIIAMVRKGGGTMTSYGLDAKIIDYMCSIGIDLFGLIDAGFAIPRRRRVT